MLLQYKIRDQMEHLSMWKEAFLYQFVRFTPILSLQLSILSLLTSKKYTAIFTEFIKMINRTTENTKGPIFKNIRGWKFHGSGWKISLTVQADNKALEEKLDKIHKEKYFKKLKSVFQSTLVTYNFCIEAHCNHSINH